MSLKANKGHLWRLMSVLMLTLVLSCACHIRPNRRIPNNGPQQISVQKPQVIPEKTMPTTTAAPLPTMIETIPTTTTIGPVIPDFVNDQPSNTAVGIDGQADETDPFCKESTDGTPTYIECYCATKALNLKTELAKLVAKTYSKLLITNCSIAKISDDMFPTKLKVSSILVNSAQDLTTFSVTKTVGLSDEVYINAPSKVQSTFIAPLITNNPNLQKLTTSLLANKEYSLASLLSADSKLAYFELLPNNYGIAKISNTAFVSKNIRFILLANIPIKTIERESFNFDDTGRQHGVQINLKNCSLNNQIVDQLHFSETERQQPLTIILENNYLKYLPEKAFNSYLRSHLVNLLFVGNNPLECDDIKNNLWLWKFEQASKQVHSALCTDKREYFSIVPYVTRCVSTTEEQNDFDCDCLKDLADDNNKDFHDGRKKNLPEFNLEQEFLYTNQLSSIAYDNIKSVKINSCPMKAIGQEFNRLKNLTSLFLNETTELASIDEKSFISNVDKITLFRLQGKNKMSLNDLVLLTTNFENLQGVNLSVDPTSDCNLKQIKNKVNLTEFRLENCRSIVSIEDNTFDGMKSLKKITLDKNSFRLKSVNEKMLKMSPDSARLEMSLRNCDIEDSYLKAGLFNNLPKMNMSLDLSWNNITLLSKENFGFVLSNSKLEIDLTGNPLKCDGDSTGSNVPADKTHALHWLYLNRNSVRYQIVNAYCAPGGRRLFEFIDHFFNGTDCGNADGDNGGDNNKPDKPNNSGVTVDTPFVALLLCFVLFVKSFF